MSDLVKDLIDKGATKEELVERLGMEVEEVNRLYEAKSMTVLGANDKFSQAWIPKFERKKKGQK